MGITPSLARAALRFCNLTNPLLPKYQYAAGGASRDPRQQSQLYRVRAVLNTIDCEEVYRQRCNLQLADRCACTELLERRKRVPARGAFDVTHATFTYANGKRAYQTQSPQVGMAGRALAHSHGFRFGNNSAPFKCINRESRPFHFCFVPSPAAKLQSVALVLASTVAKGEVSVKVLVGSTYRPRRQHTGET